MDPTSNRFGHPAQVGVSATFDLIIALKFEGNIMWPALLALDKTVVESGHRSWAIYTKTSEPSFSSRRISGEKHVAR